MERGGGQYTISTQEGQIRSRSPTMLPEPMRCDDQKTCQQKHASKNMPAKTCQQSLLPDTSARRWAPHSPGGELWSGMLPGGRQACTLCLARKMAFFSSSFSTLASSAKASRSKP